MPESPNDLIAGYAHIIRGMARYRAALRFSPGSEPVWKCHHDHAFPGGAVSCARAEKDRRVQASETVFSLRHCEPCERWWPDDAGTLCPACDVPMERLKLQVLERSPA